MDRNKEAHIIPLRGPGRAKIGSRRVHNPSAREKTRQLHLFSEGRLLRLHPLSPFEEALMMDERGEVTAARRLYGKAIQAGDRPADAYCNLGILESQEQRITEAFDCLTKSLARNPRHLEAHFNLANLYVDVGNRDLGKLHYELCIKIDPGFASSYLNLGLTLAADQEYAKALEALLQYCRLTPPHEHQTASELIRKLQAISDSSHADGNSTLDSAGYG